MQKSKTLAKRAARLRVRRVTCMSSSSCSARQLTVPARQAARAAAIFPLAPRGGRLQTLSQVSRLLGAALSQQRRGQRFLRGEWNTLGQGASRPPTTTRPPLSRGPRLPSATMARLLCLPQRRAWQQGLSPCYDAPSRLPSICTAMGSAYTTSNSPIGFVRTNPIRDA